MFLILVLEIQVYLLPKSVDDAIKDLVDNFDSVALHGYTSAQGDAHVRQSVSDYINGRFGTNAYS